MSPRLELEIDVDGRSLGRLSCEVGPRLGFADMIEGSGSGLSAGDREALIKVFSKPKPIPVRIVEECGAAWRGPYYLTTFATTQQTDAGYSFELLLEAAGKLERETGE